MSGTDANTLKHWKCQTPHGVPLIPALSLPRQRTRKP